MIADRFWQNIRAKGFLIYFTVNFAVMFLVLLFVVLSNDFLISDERFDVDNFIWWDLPINILLSFLFAVNSWYFPNRPLKLESDIIEMKLSENNGKKEKQIFERQAD